MNIEFKKKRVVGRGRGGVIGFVKFGELFFMKSRIELKLFN